MNRKSPTLVLVATLAAGAALAGEAPAKQAPPAPGTPKAFTLPAHHDFTLANGMKVTLIPYGSVPKATVTLAVRGGNAAEAKDQVWLADITALLLREGTTSRSAAEIAAAAAGMGGALEIDTGMHTTRISTDVLSEFTPRALELVADVARHPSFPESGLARLRADKVRELAIAHAESQQIALEKFLAVMYPDHPYGRLFPTEAMLQGYTLDNVKAFYGANYGGGRAHLYVAGRFDAAAVEAAARRAFGDWAAGSAPGFTPAHPRAERGLYVVDRPGAVQSTIIMGMPVIDPSQPDYLPLQVTNNLLGEAFDSRITANLREAKGYTYSPYASITSHQGAAFWAEEADVTTAVTGPSLTEIHNEIARLQKEAPTAEELKGFQNHMAGTFVLRNSSRAGIIGQLSFLELHGLPESWLTGYVQRVHAVTPQQVQQMAARYIDPAKATIVVVGDRKVVDAQLKDVAPIHE